VEDNICKLLLLIFELLKELLNIGLMLFKRLELVAHVVACFGLDLISFVWLVTNAVHRTVVMSKLQREI